MHYGGMGFIEVVEAFEQGGDLFFYVGSFQHLFPHKTGKAAYGFHGNGLVKKVNGFIAVHAEPMAEKFAVPAEIIFEKTNVLIVSQSPAQVVNVAKTAEMVFHR